MREGVDRVDALFVGGTSLSAAEHRCRRRNIAFGDGRRRRLTAGLPLAAVRPAGDLLAFGDGCQPAAGGKGRLSSTG